MKRVVFLFICLLNLSLFGSESSYLYKPAGVSFKYFGLLENKSVEKSKPLSIVFQAGETPFTVSVFFKRVIYGGSLESYIKNEKLNANKGAYEKELSIQNVSNHSISAYEIRRKSIIGKIYLFVFQSKKDNHLYTFWMTERSSLQDETEQALKAYTLMKKSLVLSE